MKKTIAIFCFVPLVAMAQTTSNSSASARTNSSSTNAGNAQSITYNNPTGIDYGGSYTTTVRSTGTAIMGGFAGSFSSDYCSGTAQSALGLVGFSLGAGAPYVSEECVLLRSFERTMQAAAVMPDPKTAQTIREAGLEIIAEVNPKIRAIYERKGLVLALPDAPPIAKP
jgi:hypothetical protein